MSSKLEEPQRRLLLGKTCGARIRAVMAAGNRLTIRQRCLCENKPIDMVRKWVYTIPNTRKGAQADETYSRCPAQAARANALLPDKFPADRLRKKQEDAVVWEKCPNTHRHNKRRTDNG